jgi:murein L,D-transpeptidase YafK
VRAVVGIGISEVEPEVVLRPGAQARVQPRLEEELAKAGLRFGAPVLLRVFKYSGELELWMHDDGRYRRFRTYCICHWSGTLGPKAWEGDHQSPEGFYAIDRTGLRARPQYHLGLDLGYPNAYDRAHGYDGAHLLVHGGCWSQGCYAMRNAAIEEIYVLVAAALEGGQPRVDVHAFPFRFDAPPRRDWRRLGWGAFWGELEPAYDQFNRTGQAPVVRVVDGHYRVDPSPGNSEARRSGPRDRAM